MNAHLGNTIAHRLAVTEVTDDGRVKPLRNARLRYTITYTF